MTDAAILLFDDHYGHDDIMRLVRTDLTSPLLDSEGNNLDLSHFDYSIDCDGVDWLSDAISNGDVFIR